VNGSTNPAEIAIGVVPALADLFGRFRQGVDFAVQGRPPHATGRAVSDQGCAGVPLAR